MVPGVGGFTRNTTAPETPFRVVAVMMMFPALTPTGTVR